MYRVRTQLTGLFGLPGLSTMFFDEAGGSAQQAVNAVGAFWAGVVTNGVQNGFQYLTEPDVDVVNSTTGQITSTVQTTSASGSSSAAGEALPWATQGLIRWRTGVYSGGREIRGRTFLPGMLESNSFGIPLASWTTPMQGVVNALIADANSTLIVWSRKNQGFAPVVSGSVWQQWAVLRSRRPE